MTTLNSYATLAEFKAYWLSRGGTNSTDTADDGVIELLLKTASRFIDSKTARHFVPYVETRYYPAPAGRDLQLDDDLLEVLMLTNGDGQVIASDYYKLHPRNASPYTAIVLNSDAAYSWGSSDEVAVYGIWGYHDRYSQAWLLGSTAAEAMDASETGYDVTSGAEFAVGNLIRFGNELGYVSNIASNTLTITRGENFSTAATHDTGINVYIWQPMEETRNAVCEIANTAYRRRQGQTTSNVATVTGAGVVLSPRDIPAMAEEFIRTYRRYT